MRWNDSFASPTLMALREIALRRVADRVEAAARDSAVSDRAPLAAGQRSGAGGHRAGCAIGAADPGR